jgi:hypothetical protein
MSLETLELPRSLCKEPELLPDFNKIWIFFSQIFIQVPNIKFHVNPSSGHRADVWTDGRRDKQTDGRKDVTNVVGSFRDHAKAPKDHFSHFGKLLLSFFSAI